MGISSEVVGRLRETFKGEVILRSDQAYEEARKVWNASIDKRPEIIVRPADVEDVVTAVRFAREHDLLTAVRGGSHSIAGFSTCDDGIVIDLARLKEIVVDPSERIADVQGGAVWKEVDAETQAFGLAVTGGLVSSTGVAGFTLGGGIGWIQRKHGLACDSLISAEIVTADGDVINASEDENPDLLWALKGGGGNFGIVTSFRFALHEVGPDVLAGLVFFKGEDAAKVLKGYRELAAAAPDELTLAAVLRKAPAAPFVPEEFHGSPVVAFAGMHIGDFQEGLNILKPLKDLAEPIADLFIERPYVQMQSMLDGSWMPGFQNYWKAEYLTSIPDDAIEVLEESLRTITSPMSDFKIPILGGAVSRVADDATSYGHRDAPFIININARWESGDPTPHIEWTRDLWRKMQPFSAGGGYTNFTSDDEGGRVVDSYGSEKYSRLAEIKRRYDPSNFFRLNQNIQPN